MIQNLTPTSPADVQELARSMLNRGYRFVTMTCTDLGEQFDVLYHFDKSYELVTFRLGLAKGQDLPSISGVYLAAAIVENEMKDLFGLTVTGLALDYEGKFILPDDAPRAPMCKTAKPAGDAAAPSESN